MDYPAWVIGGVGPGWIIGLIATFHVLVSHFAVGGGIFMPFTEAWARKNNREDIIAFLKDFSRFFLILTNVFGAISGVGIWFAIGLISPQATATLIRLFAFIWGAEWAVFLVEILSLVFYYYGWERMNPKLHLTIGWIYAITAWLSLFTINGILTFMLTPGDWNNTKNFFDGYFNPGFLPSLFVRTLVCIAMAGIYATFVISKLDPNSKMRKELLAYTSSWIIPTYVLLIGGLIWYYSQMQSGSLNNLLSGIAGGVGQAQLGSMAFVARAVTLSTVVVVTVGLAFFVSAYLNPREFTARKSAILLATMAIFVTCFEYSREMLRKPYVIRDYMFSNGVMKDAAFKLPLDRSFTAEMRFKPSDDMGEQMFVGQCMSCHTINGYRSLTQRLSPASYKDSDSIYQFLTMLQVPHTDDNRLYKFMPPVIGTEQELRALADYLHREISLATAKEGVDGHSVAMTTEKKTSSDMSAQAIKSSSI
ncbi:MAG: cytochrome ubiquinol oxidase subunit I [Candidatus Caenarcaniphilales bacterium]|nr:cytochrome ubiquinol oxidase subunit I [Candidatus Caenarcaniphilales bacterium]